MRRAGVLLAGRAAAALFLCVLLLACDVGAFRAAAFTANEAARVGWAAQPILERRCMAPMREAAAAHDGQAADRIEGRCLRILAAHEALRLLHVATVDALRAGTTADFLALAKRAGEATVNFAKALSELEDGT